MERPSVAAIVVAAGNSTRMGTNKQLLMLGDRPVIAHTLTAFQNTPAVSEIVLVTRAEDIEALRALAVQYGISKVTAVVAGGVERQDSVANGVAACSNTAAYFAIHDGARPLATPELITAVIDAAIQHGAAAAAVRVKDTVKVADKNGFIVDTPDRATLWNVQTPQVFERSLYITALESARVNGLSVTDDCRLAEAAGYPVLLVEGSYANLKITTPEDIRIAEGWL
ncbi:MAG: 2-C-methyl-D-erythritol 4-phosphate cytidylyltransferase [Clostridia bacterium]|nr:2-C-methyl-D-erythritol 4-phosphate cytidylyltransferase [Clostridia bacterium]